MECYIFRPDETGRTFMTAMMERARAGVMVTLVVDAVGSFRFGFSAIREMREAGCRVELYQRFKWYRLSRLNNRTHRELLIVDGKVAFVGGAGVGDQWAKGERGKRPWRDTMARVTGPVVSSIQGVFAENWVECCGEILCGPEYFPELHEDRRHVDDRHQELAGGSRHGMPRGLSDADRKREPSTFASTRRISFPIGRCGRHSSPPRSGA